MPLQQFDERVPQSQFDGMDDTEVPNSFGEFFESSHGDIRWDIIQLTNTDTIDHIIWFSISNDFSGLIGAVKVPAGAGNGTVPPVDALAEIMPSGFHYLIITDGSRFYFTPNEAISAGTFVVVSGFGGTV